MFACCGRPAAASFCDPFAYIVRTMRAKENDRENLPGRAGSLGAALATAGWAPPPLVRQAPAGENRRELNPPHVQRSLHHNSLSARGSEPPPPAPTARRGPA